MCYALSPWWFRDSVVNGNGYTGNSLFQYNRECNGTPVNVSAMARTTVRLRPNKEPLSPFGITIIRYRYCKVAANTFGRGRFYVDCSSTRYECECNATALDNVPENGLTICDRVRIIRIMPRWLAEVMILIHLNLILAAFDMTVNVIAMLCGIVLRNKPVSSACGNGN